MNFENFNSDTNKLNRTNFTFFFMKKPTYLYCFYHHLALRRTSLSFLVLRKPDTGYSTIDNNFIKQC